MTSVPDDAATFFTAYVPSRFESAKSAFAGRSSAGSMVFHVIDVGKWSLRLVDGELQVEEGMRDDVILQVSVTEDDFVPILVRGAEAQEGLSVRPEQQVLAFKALTIDADKAKLVRSMAGTVAFVIADAGKVRRLVVTTGDGAPKLDAPDCKLECNMNDFMDMQAGKQIPMQMAMSGKIRIVGNAQIPMALSGILS